MQALHLFRPTRRIQDQNGQAMVEFALTIPIFLAVLLGFALFGLLFYSYLTVTLAAREGARSLVGDPTQTVAQIQARVQSTSISLDPSRLTITVEPSNSQQWVSGVQVDVVASYSVPLPTITIPNLSGSPIAVFGPIPVTATSVMTIE